MHTCHPTSVRVLQNDFRRICSMHLPWDSNFENTAFRRVMEKLGMKHEKDVDLYDSVAKGGGLLPFYSIDRKAYLRNN